MSSFETLTCVTVVTKVTATVRRMIIMDGTRRSGANLNIWNTYTNDISVVRPVDNTVERKMSQSLLMASALLARFPEL